MKRLFSFIAVAMMTMTICAQRTLISYNGEETLPEGITIGGTTAQATVKINTNTNSKNAIVLKNGYSTEGEYNGNVVNVSVAGGFKAGDSIKITGVYNNAAEKNAAVCLFSLDGSKVKLLSQTENFINGRLVADDPAEQALVLSQDVDTLRLGRVGNTSTYILALSVVRPAKEITTYDLENKYTDSYRLKYIWSNWSTWTEKSNTESVQIFKVDDTHVKIYNLANLRYTMDAILDPVAKTITLDNTKSYGSYAYKMCAIPSNLTYGALYADQCNESVPAVGTIADDGTITISFCISYYGGYVIGHSTDVLVPEEIPTKCEWTATCSSSWKTSAGATSAYVADNNGMTLKKYVHGDDVIYQLSTLGGTYNGQNPSPVEFTVNENGTIEMTESNKWVYNILKYNDIVYLEGYDDSGETLLKESSFEGDGESGKLTVAYWFYANGYSEAGASEDGTITISWPYSEQQTIKGDVNGDETVNIADVNAVISVICSGEPNAAADVNADGSVNIADVNAVISIICGGE